MSTESPIKDSHSLSGSIRRKPRKIRCTQEFNDLDRKSILSVPLNGESTKKPRTRKRTDKQFLPQILLDMGIANNKENVMLNGDSPGDGKKRKLRSKRARKNGVEDLPQIEIPETYTKRSRRKKCNSSTSEQSDPAAEEQSDPAAKEQSDHAAEEQSDPTAEEQSDHAAEEQSDPATGIHNTDSEVVFKRKKKVKKSKKNKVKAVENLIESLITSERNTENDNIIDHDTEKTERKSNGVEFVRKSLGQSILKKKNSSILARQNDFEISKCEIPSGSIFVEDVDGLEADQDLEHKVSNEHCRKSVRFISPSKESVTNRRSTFDVQNNTIDVSILKSISSREESKRSENSFKSYRKSPHIKKVASRLHLNSDSKDHDLSPDKADANRGNLELSSPSLSETEAVKYNSITETSSKTPKKVSVSKKSVLAAENSSQIANDDKDISDHNDTLNKTPKDRSKSISSRRSTFEMPSPIFGPQEIDSATVTNDITTGGPEKPYSQQNLTVINLITPTASPKIQKYDESVVILEADTKKLIRESTFTRYEKMCEEMDDTKLNQSRTITKEDTVADEKPDSSLKKKKRRTWNKSLHVSFLNNSGQLQNITAPWTREKKDVSIQEIETPKGNKAMLVKKFETPKLSKVTKTPPSDTSTPLPADKKHLLRAALLKDMHVRIDESNNSSVVVQKPKKTTSSVPKPTKMPNFAMIHQKAYDKMENLQEMSERKASRAKLLLSGQKPIIEIGSKRKSPSKNRKLLHYSPRTVTTQTTPKLASNLVTKVKAITPSTSNPRVLPKSTEPSKMRSFIPKLRNNKVVPEKKGLTKLGFKIGPEAAKSITREQQVKAIINKSKVATSTVDQRRNDMKNVRTNRRFELLMKMRNQNKS